MGYKILLPASKAIAEYCESWALEPWTQTKVKAMKSKAKPPFDPRATSFEDETRTFEEAVFHFLPLENRTQWMQPNRFPDLTVFQVGYFKKAHGHSVERRDLDEGILIYCVDGKGQFSQKGGSWTVAPGDLLYCYPKSHHSYRADTKDPWTIHWMHVSGPRMAYYRKLIGFSPSAPIVRLGIHIDIVDLFRSLYALYEPFNDESHLAAMYACAQHILATIALAKRPSNERPQWEREIQAVITYMEECVDKKMQLEDFSEYLGLSRFHFSRRFKAITNMSPMKYFMHLKMKKAGYMLQTTSLKVKAVSRSLGFDSEYYFSRCFKSSVGCSPQKYCKMP